MKLSKSFIEQLGELNLISESSNLELKSSVKTIKIDVGCASGHLMAQWLETDEGLFAVGIEPNPNSLKTAKELLSENYGPEGVRWVVLSGALGPAEASLRFFVPNESPDQGSLLHPENPKQVLSFEVHVEPLSNLLSILLSGGILNVDFLKTDCQGLDLEVLKSGGQQLQHVKVITSEADSEGYLGATNSIQAMDNYLVGLGFTHTNKRSSVRRLAGGFLHKIKLGPILGLRLPNFSKGRKLQGAGINTQDPTFVNHRFKDQVLAGYVRAFQEG